MSHERVTIAVVFYRCRMTVSVHPWPAVRPGDTVALVSPASWPEPDDVDALEAELTPWGLRVRRGKHLLHRHGYLAGGDRQRLEDLNAAIEDPEIRAVVSTRGGCGSFRRRRGVDTEALRRDPKPLVGFSDLTALHLVWWLAAVPSLHGAVAGAHADDVRVPPGCALLAGAGRPRRTAAPCRSGFPAASTPAPAS